LPFGFFEAFFLTCLAFFQRPNKAGQNLALSAFDMFGFISNIKKKPTKYVSFWLFSGYFSEQ